MGELQTQLEAAEREGWDSLCDGTAADFYGRTMTDDGVMVLANGMVLSRDQVVTSLRDAPTWTSYEWSDVRTVGIGSDCAALVYVATARRGDDDAFVCAMSSVYVRAGTGWRLALYTQTPLPEER